MTHFVAVFLFFFFIFSLWKVPAFAETVKDTHGDGDGWGDEEESWGEEESGWEDASDDVGFGGIDEPSDADSAEPPKPVVEDPREDPTSSSPWQLNGFSRSDLGMWTQRSKTNRFATARQSLDLSARYKNGNFRGIVSVHGEYDFSYLYLRDSYDAGTLDTYEYLFDIRDTYLVGTFKNVDITIGKQVVVWGQGDMIPLLDVVCPRDLREPGLTDMEDMRLPVLSSRLSLYHGSHRFEAMVIHEAFFGYRPPPLGDYSPLTALLPDDAKEDLEGIPVWYEDKQDRFDVANQQYLARWMYKGQGVDLELYGASVLDSTGTIEFDQVKLLSDVINGNRATIVLDHSRYTMLGHSAAWPMGSWLFKWELGVDINRALNVGNATGIRVQADSARANVVGGLLGITYSGFRDTMIFLELKKSVVLDHIPDMLLPIEEPTVALRYNRNLLREDLRLSLLLLMYGRNVKYGWFGRVQMEYVLRDGLRIAAGYITYHPGSEFGILSGMTDTDRLYLQLRWDFSGPTP